MTTEPLTGAAPDHARVIKAAIVQMMRKDRKAGTQIDAANAAMDHLAALAAERDALRGERDALAARAERLRRLVRAKIDIERWQPGSIPPEVLTEHREAWAACCRHDDLTAGSGEASDG